MVASGSKCRSCREPAVIDLPRHNANFCPEHFLDFARKQVERAIDDFEMFAKDDKILVAVAGPLSSLGLAAVFAGAVWWMGRPVSEAEATTTIGYVLPDSPAEKAGLRAGDRILAIDDQPVSRWGGISADSVTWRIGGSEGDIVRVRYERDGSTVEASATPVIPERRVWQRRATRHAGCRAGCRSR